MLYLTLRQYEYVCAVGRHGSLSAAAGALHVSQPALSAALARIEGHLGHPLFIRRRGSSMAVTPEGRRFIAEAEALLADAARIEDPAHPRPARQRLHLGCFSDLAPFLLAPALRALREAMPDVAVSFRAEGFEAIISGLLKGQVDLALTYDLGLDAGFHRESLFDSRPHAVMSTDHPLSRGAPPDLAALTGYPLILSDEGLSAQHMLGLFRTRGLNPVVAHRAATLELLRSLAAHGEGVGISYARPFHETSYDGMPLLCREIADPDLGESVILVRHGAGPVDGTTERAGQVLAGLFRPR
ncbi:LysR family transcriptional regulator [Ruegeria marina]|uniref:Transcriptional regulator, LysR family n=1 Tax=Ruegeria marina TaxID=639004 RepID=A0A1G6UB36_9RHOB|nr:LysR family transcriptional regulator [Ruegeria marina]SDD38612.1 transcriptional regulator, LysR family [Ruegeria marina]